MSVIQKYLPVPEHEIEITAIRAQGAGGQNVNKVASAIHLRFDIRASSLPETHKRRLLELKDQRITGEGVIVIKAQKYRRQEQNKEDAMARLESLIRCVAVTPRKRVPTRATRASKKKRMDQKTRRGQDKSLRGRVKGED